VKVGGRFSFFFFDCCFVLFFISVCTIVRKKKRKCSIYLYKGLCSDLRRKGFCEEAEIYILVSESKRKEMKSGGERNGIRRFGMIINEIKKGVDQAFLGMTCGSRQLALARA